MCEVRPNLGAVQQHYQPWLSDDTPCELLYRHARGLSMNHAEPTGGVFLVMAVQCPCKKNKKGGTNGGEPRRAPPTGASRRAPSTGTPARAPEQQLCLKVQEVRETIREITPDGRPYTRPTIRDTSRAGERTGDHTGDRETTRER